MLYGKLPNIDKPVSRLVQGTTVLDEREVERCYELLDGAFELGCRTFDTAHVYGQGMQERLFGRWLRERGLRDQVVIIGKGAHLSQDRKRVTPYDITADLHDSLARMKIDYIDLYLLHRDDPEVPVGPIVETLDEHLRAGKIRAYGGSNWSYERIAEANAYAAAHGLQPFVASSPNFSLAVQIKPPWPGCVSISGAQGKAAREWYLANNMPIFAWSSLAGGFFNGRVRRDTVATLTNNQDKLAAESYGSEENFARLDRAEELAARKGISVPQVVLAYILSQPLDIYPLVGGYTIAEFRANAAACDTPLSADEVAYLEGV